MGSSLSPILTILMCAYCENNFLKTLGIHEKYIHGVRYVDDLMIVVRWRRKNTEDYGRVKKLLVQVRNRLYFPSMNVEKQERGRKVKMLECDVTCDATNTFRCSQHRKNWQSFVESEKQKWKKGVLYDSYSPLDTKRGVLMGEMKRIQRACDNPRDVLSSVCKATVEWRSLGYSWSFVENALRRLMERDENRIWEAALMMIKCLIKPVLSVTDPGAGQERFRVQGVPSRG